MNVLMCKPEHKIVVEQLKCEENRTKMWIAGSAVAAFAYSVLLNRHNCYHCHPPNIQICVQLKAHMNLANQRATDVVCSLNVKITRKNRVRKMHSRPKLRIKKNCTFLAKRMGKKNKWKLITKEWDINHTLKPADTHTPHSTLHTTFNHQWLKH